MWYSHIHINCDPFWFSRFIIYLLNNRCYILVINLLVQSLDILLCFSESECCPRIPEAFQLESHNGIESRWTIRCTKMLEVQGLSKAFQTTWRTNNYVLTRCWHLGLTHSYWRIFWFRWSVSPTSCKCSKCIFIIFWF